MPAKPSFYWHDYETFGADPACDRPSQFAGVRTDAELNEIGEPLMIYCRPPADYLPHPEACLITGITPQQAREHGLAEPEFIARINAELSAARHLRGGLQQHPLRRRGHALRAVPQFLSTPTSANGATATRAGT